MVLFSPRELISISKPSRSGRRRRKTGRLDPKTRKFTDVKTEVVEPTKKEVIEIEQRRTASIKEQLTREKELTPSSPLSFDPSEIQRRRGTFSPRQLQSSLLAEQRLRESLLPRVDTSTRISRAFSRGDIRLKTRFVDPVTGVVSGSIGRLGLATGKDFPTTISQARVSSRRTTELLEERGVPRPITRTGEFISGFGLSATEDIIQRPFKQAVIVGASFGVGTGLGFAGAGATRLGGAAPFIFKTSEIVVGSVLLGREIFKTGVEVREAEDALGKGGVVGVAVKDVSLFGFGITAGQRGATSLLGRFRTRGLTQLPAEDIIAPEFTIKGETFPSIRRGQTAGQLRSEFLQPALPGEVVGPPRGFTARSFDLGDIIPPSKGKGGELVGLFQSPRVSPVFLRVIQQGQRVFGLSTPAAGRPSIVRLQTETIELAPGVSPGQTRPSPLGFSSKEFSESIAGTGRSVIPFVKTEKEAVVAVSTPVIKTAERFFIKFEGTRVPIREFVTISSPKGRAADVFKFPKTRDILSISKESSLGRIKSSALFTPSSVGLGLGFSVLSSSMPGTTSTPPSFPSLGGGGRSSSRRISSSSSTFLPPPSSIPRGGETPSSFFVPPSVPSSVTPPISSEVTPSIISQIRPSRISESALFAPIGLPSRRPRGRRRRPERQFGITSRIAPSLTGIGLQQLGDITGPLPTGTQAFGVFPTDIRLVPLGKKRKKKKKKA